MPTKSNEELDQEIIRKKQSEALNSTEPSGLNDHRRGV